MKTTMSPSGRVDSASTPMHPHCKNPDSASDESSYFEDESVDHASDDDMRAADEAEAAALAEPETIAVRILRVITIMVMVGATIAVSVYVYVFMKNNEEEALEENFYDLANRLVDGFHANAALRVQTLDMLGVSLTSSAIATNQTWPYCTFDDFEARATAARAIIKSDYVGWMPYVTDENKKEWEAYTAQNTYWLNESFAYQEDFKSVHNRTVGVRAPARALRSMSQDEGDYLSRWLLEESEAQDMDIDDDAPGVRNATFDGPDGIPLEIYRYGSDEEGYLFVFDDTPGPYYPMWQVSPTREFSAIDVNFNLADEFYSGAFSAAPEVVRTTQTAIFGGVWNVDDTGYIDENDDYDFRSVPAAALIYPIFDKLSGDKEVVAIFELDYEFGPLFTAVLPSNSNRLVCVVRNTCNQVFTFEVTGETATYMGPEDLHDENFDHMMVSALLTDFQKTTSTIYNGPPINEDFCPWVLEVYGTQDMRDAHITSQPVYYMCAALGIFLFTCLTFCVYDCLVEFRQRKVSKLARRSEKIVSSLFPKNFREKLYVSEKKKEKARAEEKRASMGFGTQCSNHTRKSTAWRNSQQSNPVHNFLAGGSLHSSGKPESHPELEDSIANSPPIAELYPDCTVFFADIAGFTAWSSARSPTEVFTLLETVYGAFDMLAAKHRVFKIETIGDCYVAVTGLPKAQPTHALQMCKFSRDVHAKMKKLTRKLESTLGPDTGNLAMRIGLHSGSVTAGVLRGEKARFQLFGDTVNTASRMESNGQREMIHVSQVTADILKKHGKEHWLHAREEKVQAKGKGEMQTYFVRPTSGAGSVTSALSSSDGGSVYEECEEIEDVELALKDFEGTEEQKSEWAENNHRQIAWLTDLLREELKKIMTQRNESVDSSSCNDRYLINQDYVWNDDIYDALLSSGDTGDAVSVSEDLSRQLFEFVAQIAYSYQDVPYHSFDHACVVVMSTDKMLKQIQRMLDSDLSLSPWVRFACLLSALIRNLDPPSVPDFDIHANHILKNKSPSTLTSTARAMKLMRSSRFEHLKESLCATKLEFSRFWNLVQNLILATDTSGSILSAQRNRRWLAAFGSAMHHQMSAASPTEKVVTVLEHIALLGQDSYAVQHWENFAKWNDLMLREYCDEHQTGTLVVDPAPIWHQSQMNYLDNCVIPLTQKIDHAGVLGAIGGEFSMYASQNLQEMASGTRGGNPPAPHRPPTNILDSSLQKLAPISEGSRHHAPQQSSADVPITRYETNLTATSTPPSSDSFSSAENREPPVPAFEYIVEV